MTAQPDAATDRHRLILDRLETIGRVEVGELAARLGVAQETIRRDLRQLERTGLLQRVHGGAVPNEAETLSPFPGSTPELPDAHVRLAERVVERLPRSGAVLVGASPLTWAVAESLARRAGEHQGLTVVTTSLDVAVVLSRVAAIHVYNVGGAVSPGNRAQEGDWALAELARLRVDIALLTPAGVHLEHGLSTLSPMTAATSEAEARAAAAIWLLVEPAALGRTALVRFAGMDRVTTILTTAEVLDPALNRAFAAAGIAVDPP